MVLLSLVATHSDVDLETVARLSAGASEVASSVVRDGQGVSGAVVLATWFMTLIIQRAELLLAQEYLSSRVRHSAPTSFAAWPGDRL